MNSAQLDLIRLMAKQAVREYLAGKPAPACEKPKTRSSRPVSLKKLSK